jgi:hypothetical protein
MIVAEFRDKAKPLHCLAPKIPAQPRSTANISLKDSAGMGACPSHLHPYTGIIHLTDPGLAALLCLEFAGLAFWLG